MGYSALIDKQVTTAFNQLKDLAVSVVLTKIDASSFNFGDSTSTDTESSMITKVVVTDTSKKSKDRNTNEKLLMLKTKQVGDLNNFSKVTIDGVVWKIVTPLEHNGYVTVARIVKES